jgi:predicted MFS family arabinose efflux permease
LFTLLSILAAMRRVGAYIRGLNPELPRSVQILQVGGLLNALGNGLVLPFLFIYLHEVRDMSPAVSGLIVGTNSAVSIVAGPAYGALIDRIGPRRTLTIALGLMACGFASYPLVHEPWQGFLAAAVAGLGNGGFWPSQSTLVAGLTPPERMHAAFAMQRIVMNLGIGLGVVIGGLIASTSAPGSFTLLFLADASTFVIFGLVLRLVPDRGQPREREQPAGGFGTLLRHRPFMLVIALHVAFVTAGIAQFEIWPGYMTSEAGVSERGVAIVFAVNTVLIVLAQLPVSQWLEGRRRMPAMLGVGLTWGAAWLSVPLVGASADGVLAAGLFCIAGMVFAVGECLHGAVQGPLVVDLSDERLLGRYMAVSALSWSVGFAAGPAIGGFLLGVSPPLLWLAAGSVCVLAGLASVAIEPLLPRSVRRTAGGRMAEA